MDVVLSIATLVITGFVGIGGWLINRRADRRLEQEQRFDNERLRVDASMRAAELFGSQDEAPDPAASASGLLALTALGRAELAVALLVDLWSVEYTPASQRENNTPTAAEPASIDTASGKRTRISTETAILVIDAALKGESGRNAQLVAAELLCRNSKRLDPCQSLHWPASVDGRWVPTLPTRAKLLLVDALLTMTLNSAPQENALRSVALRLYGIWSGDENERVRGCIGTLIKALLPAIRALPYEDFLQTQEPVTQDQLEEAARSASSNPDGYLEQILMERSKTLAEWSNRCSGCDFGPGSLARAVA